MKVVDEIFDPRDQPVVSQPEATKGKSVLFRLSGLQSRNINCLLPEDDINTSSSSDMLQAIPNRRN